MEYPRHLARLTAFRQIDFNQMLEMFLFSIQNNKFESGLAIVLKDQNTVIRLPPSTGEDNYLTNLELLIDLIATKDPHINGITRNIISLAFLSSVTLHRGLPSTVELSDTRMQENIVEEMATLERYIQHLPELGITFAEVDHESINFEFFEVFCASDALASRVEEFLNVFPVCPDTWNHHTLRMLDVLHPQCLNVSLTDSAHPLDKLSFQRMQDTAINLHIDYDNDVLESQIAFATLLTAFREAGETLTFFSLTLTYYGDGFETWLSLLRRYYDVIGTEIYLDVLIDDDDDDDDDEDDEIAMNPEDLLITIRETLNHFCVRHTMDEDESSADRAVFTLFMEDDEY